MKFLYILNKFFNPFYWWSVIRRQHAPADKSNRHWKPILLWFCFTRYEMVLDRTNWEMSRWELIMEGMFHEESFVDAFPFLRYDLWELLVLMFEERNE